MAYSADDSWADESLSELPLETRMYYSIDSLKDRVLAIERFGYPLSCTLHTDTYYHCEIDGVLWLRRRLTNHTESNDCCNIVVQLGQESSATRKEESITCEELQKLSPVELFSCQVLRFLLASGVYLDIVKPDPAYSEQTLYCAVFSTPHSQECGMQPSLSKIVQFMEYFLESPHAMELEIQGVSGGQYTQFPKEIVTDFCKEQDLSHLLPPQDSSKVRRTFVRELERFIGDASICQKLFGTSFTEILRVEIVEGGRVLSDAVQRDEKSALIESLCRACEEFGIP